MHRIQKIIKQGKDDCPNTARYSNLKQDCARITKHSNSVNSIFLYSLKSPDFLATVFYRFAHSVARNTSDSAKLLRYFSKLLTNLVQILSRILTQSHVDHRSTIGGGVKITHSFGLIVGSKAVLGKNVTLTQGVTIGGNFWKTNMEGRTMPIIGDNVFIGHHSSILGPIRIGSHVVIAPHTVITNDLKGNACYAGNPVQQILPKNKIITKTIRGIYLNDV